MGIGLGASAGVGEGVAVTSAASTIGEADGVGVGEGTTGADGLSPEQAATDRARTAHARAVARHRHTIPCIDARWVFIWDSLHEPPSRAVYDEAPVASSARYDARLSWWISPWTHRIITTGRRAIARTLRLNAGPHAPAQILSAKWDTRTMSTTLARDEHAARAIFAPIAPNYDRWSVLLSMGQDPRWRAEMVAHLDAPPGAWVLDVAAGTGLITKLLEGRSHKVISLDVSREMLSEARRRGAEAVLATAERLPFADESFDALTFGYLLRYVADPLDTMRELVRVLRPGATIGMVEFGRPGGLWRPLWWLYTRLVLPAAAVIAGRGWWKVGRFLGPSIDGFVDRYPDAALIPLWEAAGLVDVRLARPSLGGGLLMWGRRP